MSAIIYRLTNIVNGKTYIGLTSKSLKYRWSSHCSEARRGVETKLYRAMRKYGEDAFTREVLEETTTDLMNEREIHWIATLSPEYNMTAGGEGITGHVHSAKTRQLLKERARHRPPISDETRQRISVAKRGVRATDIAKQHMSEGRRGELNHFFGRTHTDETRAKIGAAHRGKTLSPETRAKISAAARNMSPETRAKISAAARNISPETRAKMSAAAKARAARRRALRQAHEMSSPV